MVGSLWIFVELSLTELIQKIFFSIIFIGCFENIPRGIPKLCVYFFLWRIAITSLWFSNLPNLLYIWRNSALKEFIILLETLFNQTFSKFISPWTPNTTQNLAHRRLSVNICVPWMNEYNLWPSWTSLSYNIYFWKSFTEYMLRPMCQERIPVALCFYTPGRVFALCLWKDEGFISSFPPSLATYAFIHTTYTVYVESVHVLLPGFDWALFDSRSKFLATAVLEQGRVTRDRMVGWLLRFISRLSHA